MSNAVAIGVVEGCRGSGLRAYTRRGFLRVLIPSLLLLIGGLRSFFRRGSFSRKGMDDGTGASLSEQC